MNESLFGMYCRTKELIARTEACKNEHSDNLLLLLNLYLVLNPKLN